MNSPLNKPTVNEVVSFLTSSTLFNGIDEASLHSLAQQLKYVALPSDQVLIREGEIGNTLYILMSGRLRVVKRYGEKDETMFNEIQPGKTVGEMALFVSEKRANTVYAINDCQLLEMSNESYYKISKLYPDITVRLNQTIEDDLRRYYLHSALNSSARFSQLDQSVLQDLEAELTWQTLKTGTTLIKQGTDSESVYLISVGRLRVIVEHPEQGEQVINEIGRGESIGEVAFFTHEKHLQTVYAIRDTEVAELSRESFNKLLNKYPLPITRAFSQTIIQKLSQEIKHGKQFSNTIKTLGIIPTSPEVPLSEFTIRFVQCLSKMNYNTLHLTSSFVDQELGKEGIAQDDLDVWDAIDVTLISWLSEQETKYDYVIYQADSTSTEWSRRCIRQADHIVLLGDANSHPSLSKLESEQRLHLPGDHSNSRKSLVLLHNESTQLPSGTKRWLELRQVEQHYHIRRDRAADFERLARIVTGNAISLVLSGGGARGLAHIGAIRALQEANIPIDMIGGTSQGSLIGGLAAMNWHPDHMSTECSQLLTRPGYNFPIVALASGKRWTTVLQKLFGEIQIEDLWLNYFCVSANLTHAKMKVHRSGLLWKSVRASSSLPGILPPICDGEELLVDGGILSNLPVEVMVQHNHGGKVIASDVSATSNIKVITEIEGVLNGFYVIWRKYNPFLKTLEIPSIHEILMQSAMITSTNTLDKTKQMADVYIKLSVNQYGMLDFKKLAEIAEIGYQAAKEQIAKQKSEGKFDDFIQAK